eukprot:6019561-Alexandrium_andersonii.AAC.1
MERGFADDRAPEATEHLLDPGETMQTPHCAPEQARGGASARAEEGWPVLDYASAHDGIVSHVL